MIREALADLARPFAIVSTSFAASWAIIVVSYRVDDGNDGALFIAAALAGVGAIYIGKSVEVFKSNQAAATVEVAKAKATTPPPGVVATGDSPTINTNGEAVVEPEPLPWPPTK